MDQEERDVERERKRRLLKELTTFRGNMGEPETRAELDRKRALIESLRAELGLRED